MDVMEYKQRAWSEVDSYRGAWPPSVALKRAIIKAARNQCDEVSPEQMVRDFVDIAEFEREEAARLAAIGPIPPISGDDIPL